MQSLIKMNSSPTSRSRVILIRPGALGDVLACRLALYAARLAFPQELVALLAPGARGQLLFHPGHLADSIFDWENRDTAWLFAPIADNSEPSTRLREFFLNANLAMVYLNSDQEQLRQRLSRLGCRKICFWSPLSAPEQEVSIYQHLAEPWFHEGRFVNAPQELLSDLPQRLDCQLASLIVPRHNVTKLRQNWSLPQDFAVIHPGSGSQRKNWPREYFIKLGIWLQSRLPVIITAGEADGNLGQDIAAAIPQSRYLPFLDLQEMAALLVIAKLYVGNDSGISHLASAVVGDDNKENKISGLELKTKIPARPRGIVIFNTTSSSRIWAPPGLTIVSPEEKQMTTDWIGEIAPAATVQAECEKILNWQDSFQ